MRSMTRGESAHASAERAPEPRRTVVGRVAGIVRAFVLVAALWLTAGNDPSAQAQGTLKVIPHASLRVLDPVWTTAYISRNHGYLIYDTLFAMDEQFKIRPQMVESYQVSPDRLTWRFTLRKGLKWHDGAPVTARDCIASIRRWGARDTMGQQLMSFIRELNAVSDSTFQMSLKEPFGLVLDALGKPSSNVPFMMPERVAMTDPSKSIEDATGSGPFKFVKEEFQFGVKAVYVKNADYVPRGEPPSFLAGGKVAYLDRVEWVYVPDYNTALSAVVAGEMDYMEVIPPELTALFRDNPKMQVVRQADGQLILRVNHLHPPFNNVKIRQALYYLVDQSGYMQATVGSSEWSKVCWAMYVCGGPYETAAGAERFKPDVAQAQRLLKEGGYSGEKVVILDATDLYVSHNPAQVTAQRLRQAGMNVELQAMDWSTLLTRRADKKPIGEGGWSIFHTFVASVDQYLPASNQQVAGLCEKGWFGWYCDPQMEELRARWARAADPAQQKALAVETQMRAYAQGAYVLLGQITQVRAISSRVKGVKGPIPLFWNVRKE